MARPALAAQPAMATQPGHHQGTPPRLEGCGRATLALSSLAHGSYSVPGKAQLRRSQLALPGARARARLLVI